jgi:hypothetical protein
VFARLLLHRDKKLSVWRFRAPLHLLIADLNFLVKVLTYLISLGKCDLEHKTQYFVAIAMPSAGSGRAFTLTRACETGFIRSQNRTYEMFSLHHVHERALMVVARRRSNWRESSGRS